MTTLVKESTFRLRDKVVTVYASPTEVYRTWRRQSISKIIKASGLKDMAMLELLDWLKSGNDSSLELAAREYGIEIGRSPRA